MPRHVVAAFTVVALLVPAAAWAGHRFNDVPASNVFHDDIDWLADSGVTRGCNPPDNTRFCPSDLVTREQLAAFFRRLQTEDVFLAPPDTATHDQRMAIRSLHETSDALPKITDGTRREVATVGISYPASGTIRAEYDTTASLSTAGMSGQLYLRPSSVACAEGLGELFYIASTAQRRAHENSQRVSMAGSAYLDVTGEGTRTFRLCGMASGGTFTPRGVSVRLVWTPAAASTSTGVQEDSL